MLQPAFKKFFRAILIYSVAINLVAIVLLKWCIPGLYPPEFPLYLLFFLAVNSLFFYMVLTGSGQRPAVFARRFLLGSGLKFFIYIIFLLVYLLAYRRHALSFLFQFIGLYFLYTLFEIIYLLRQMKNE